MFPSRILFLSSLATLAAAAEPLDFTSKLDAIREKYHVPALAAAEMREGELVVLGASGIRRMGASDAVTVNDLWHIGSCTKSMTATLAGVLVDEGKARWDLTVGEAFPEFRGSMNKDWAAVRLDQLLSNRSGAPHEPPPAAWNEAAKEKGTPSAQRLAFVKAVLKEPLEAPAGTKFIYSNQGFAIAGTILERLAKKPYEELLQEKVFAPLGIKSAGFGAPGPKQPVGHASANGSLKPIDPGRGADNPIAITPAGRVHLSITDFVRYASWHARGPLADTKLMSDATFTRLHTPAAGQEYAMGWIVAPREWAKGNALMHTGSNTMWFVVMWIAPATQTAYVAACNSAGDDAAKACDEAVAGMIMNR